MNKTTKAPQESEYWKAMKAGLKTLFGKRVRITDIPNKGGKHGH